MRLFHCVVIKILRIRTHIALFFAVHFAASPLSLSLLSYMVRVWVCARVLPYRLADFTCRTTTLALACEIKLFVGSRRIKIKFLLFLPLLLLLLLTVLELLLLRPRAEASVTVTAAQPQSHHAPKPPTHGRGCRHAGDEMPPSGCHLAAAVVVSTRFFWVACGKKGVWQGEGIRGGGRGLAKRERSTFCGKLS